MYVMIGLIHLLLNSFLVAKRYEHIRRRATQMNNEELQTRKKLD